MKRVVLSDLLESTRAGYWGEHPGAADIDVAVIRNGDVKATGVLWEELPTRSMTTRQVDQSRVVLDDLLITTSGECGVTAFIGAAPMRETCASNFVRIL